MTDETNAEALITAEEQETARRRSMAFNAEACRSGLFAAALDIAEELRKNDVPNGEACLLTGAAEFVAQLWQQVAENSGTITPKKARETLIKEINTFYHKHRNAAGAPDATKH